MDLQRGGRGNHPPFGREPEKGRTHKRDEGERKKKDNRKKEGKWGVNVKRTTREDSFNWGKK